MAAQDPDKVSDSCKWRHLVLSPAHPLSFRGADAISSDGRRPPSAGRFGGRQELDRRVTQGGLDQRRGRPFTGDARLDGFEKGRSGGGDAATDDDAADAQRQSERPDGPGEVIGDAICDLDGYLVAGGPGSEDISRARAG